MKEIRPKKIREDKFKVGDRVTCAYASEKGKIGRAHV